PFYPDIAGDNSPSVPKFVNFLGAGPRKLRYCSASLSITSESVQLVAVWGLLSLLPLKLDHNDSCTCCRIMFA
ncbi:MAG: hypothetical protein IJ322_05840, partial [Clostridia bacterium]|nr:hypothetical protein [Clostridia bacterium]